MAPSTKQVPATQTATRKPKAKVKPLSIYQTSIPVEKVCAKTGKVLKQFPSLGLAAIHAGVRKSTLRRWANGDGRSREKGVIWRHAANKGQEHHHYVRNSKLVQQICPQTGAVLRTFESVREAARTFNITTTNISGVCHGRGRTAAGFKWRLVGWRNELLQSSGNTEAESGQSEEELLLRKSNQSSAQDSKTKVKETDQPNIQKKMSFSPSVCAEQHNQPLEDKAGNPAQAGGKTRKQAALSNIEESQETQSEYCGQANNIPWDLGRPRLLPRRTMTSRAYLATKRYLPLQHGDGANMNSHPYTNLQDTANYPLFSGRQMSLVDPRFFHIRPHMVPQPGLPSVDYHYSPGPGPDSILGWPNPLHLRMAAAAAATTSRALQNAAVTRAFLRAYELNHQLSECFSREEEEECIPPVTSSAPESARSSIEPTYSIRACRRAHR